MELCKGCIYQRFPKMRPQPPFSAQIAIVGEAPGTSELSRHECFIGPAGQLLEKALKSSGFCDRSQIYMTNALLCLPPPNKPQVREAINRCRSRVIEEIKSSGATLVLALGNIALHSLTGDFDLKITKVQGQIITSQYLPGVNILAVIHPSAVIRSPGNYKVFMSAMHYGGQLFRGAEIKDPGVVKYQIVDTENKLNQAIAYLESREDNIVAADIETTGLSALSDKVLVLGIAYDYNRVLIFPPDMITSRILNMQATWVWQNGKFDTSFISAPFNEDILLMSYALNEQGGFHDLEQMASRELGAEPYKFKVREKIGKAGFGALPKEDLYQRVATDADYTRQLYFKYLPRIKQDPDLERLYYNLLLPASEFLRRVQLRGIYVNVSLLQQFRVEYEQIVEQLKNDLIDQAMPYWNPQRYKMMTGAKTAPEIFNPGSTKQVAWLLFDVLRLKHNLRGKKRSTDAEVLEELKGKHKIVDAMLEYRAVAKELSTYIIGIADRLGPDGRIHTTFNLHGTVTGRLSSRDPNIQNQPKKRPKVRTVFQATPGMRLIEADYKGAELRVLAHMSGDDFLKGCFIAGRDLHSEVATAFFGPNFTHEDRMKAKTVNFGIPYGRSEFSLAEAFNMSRAEAQDLIDKWFARAPKAQIYLQNCADAVLQGRTLTTPFGRKRRFGLVSKDTLHGLQNEARNFTIQSVSSDLTLLSAMTCENRIAELGGGVLNLVHDSILVEVPDSPEVVEHAIAAMNAAMTTVPQKYLNTEVPFVAEFSTGYQWGDLQEVEL